MCNSKHHPGVRHDPFFIHLYHNRLYSTPTQLDHTGLHLDKQGILLPRHKASHTVVPVLLPRDKLIVEAVQEPGKHHPHLGIRQVLADAIPLAVAERA